MTEHIQGRTRLKRGDAPGAVTGPCAQVRNAQYFARIFCTMYVPEIIDHRKPCEFHSYAHAPEAWRARPLRRPPSALAREALANSVNSSFRKIAAALNARSVPAAKAGYGQPCRSGAWWNERRLGDETVQATWRGRPLVGFGTASGRTTGRGRPAVVGPWSRRATSP